MDTDITSRTDVELLVNRFYDKVKADELLSPVFSQVDWPQHLPIMYNFWASMLLGEDTYKGNPFQKHMGLNIQTQHFGRWLELFISTLDENFEGTKADEAKTRARDIAGVFQFRLGLMKNS